MKIWPEKNRRFATQSSFFEGLTCKTSNPGNDHEGLLIADYSAEPFPDLQGISVQKDMQNLTLRYLGMVPDLCLGWLRLVALLSGLLLASLGPEPPASLADLTFSRMKFFGFADSVQK